MKSNLYPYNISFFQGKKWVPTELKRKRGRARHPSGVRVYRALQRSLGEDGGERDGAPRNNRLAARRPPATSDTRASSLRISRSPAPLPALAPCPLTFFFFLLTRTFPPSLSPTPSTFFTLFRSIHLLENHNLCMSFSITTIKVPDLGQECSGG